MFLQRKGWKEVGTAPWDKADKWKMQLQIYLIENVLGSLSWATAQASHIHMRCRKGEAVHALQTIYCHHYTPMSFLHIFGCESGLKYCLKQQCDLYHFLVYLCMSVTPQNVFEHTYTIWYHAVFIWKCYELLILWLNWIMGKIRAID